MLDYAVVIMRAQGLHVMHKALMDIALASAKQVIVAFGSDNKAMSAKNPFSVAQRYMTLEAIYGKDVVGAHPSSRIVVTYLMDYAYDNTKWKMGVTQKVKNITGCGSNPNPKIGLVTYRKDETSFYQDMFPEWEEINTYAEINEKFPDLAGKLDATDVRKAWYEGRLDDVKDMLPEATYKFMTAFQKNMPKRFESLVAMHEFNKNYKATMSLNKFPSFIMCADSIVVKNNHVLLVKRGKAPGKGTWAMPGGHVNIDEWGKKASKRELEEETGLVLDKTEPLKSFFLEAPGRSEKGRVLSMAYFYYLGVEGEMPEVKAADDAAECKWVHIPDLYDVLGDYYGNMFEDHWEALDHAFDEMDILIDRE